MKRELYAGFDVGSRFIKLCLVEQGAPVAMELARPARPLDRVFRQLFEQALGRAAAKKGDVKNMAATGYGARMAPRVNLFMGEGLCALKGAWNLDPQTQTVVDMGGLFIRVQLAGPNHKPGPMATNEMCAAGSGKFVEMAAQALEIPFEMVSRQAGEATGKCSIHSNCAVFAESEVVSQVNAGVHANEILAGVLDSVAARTASLFMSLNPRDKIYLCGGLALVRAFVDVLEKRVGKKVYLPEIDPRMLPAFGAALLAAEKGPRPGVLQELASRVLGSKNGF